MFTIDNQQESSIMIGDHDLSVAYDCETNSNQDAKMQPELPVRMIITAI